MLATARFSGHWHGDCYEKPLEARRGASNEVNQLGKGQQVINLIAWLVVGGILGWIASMIMRTDAQQGIGLNIVVGIVGALIAGFLVSPLVGLPTINEGGFSVGSMLVSLLGAVILLAIVNLFRRGRVR
jgi:uncharacterized membrane protein YeaQ/YmgE (transglycosylase-associated protein family)